MRTIAVLSGQKPLPIDNLRPSTGRKRAMNPATRTTRSSPTNRPSHPRPGAKAATGKRRRPSWRWGVSFDVPRGQIFGLLGPNGAGQPLINTLAGLVLKTSGSVEIWGASTSTTDRRAKAAIGIVPQEIVFDPFFTPIEVLDIQAGLYGVPKHLRRSMELLRAVHLADKAGLFPLAVGRHEAGLLIAKAMVHTPPILVLDEPTAGWTWNCAANCGNW
jgi:ABC-2 type transport system ATP-binding protein